MLQKGYHEQLGSAGWPLGCHSPLTACAAVPLEQQLPPLLQLLLLLRQALAAATMGPYLGPCPHLVATPGVPYGQHMRHSLLRPLPLLLLPCQWVTLC